MPTQPPARFTGAKLTKIENDPKAIEAIEYLLAGKFSDSNSTDEILSALYKILQEKTSDCINPISQAYYSAIAIFEKNDKIYVHAGANIDPESPERFKDPDYRNCAEKQAMLSAAQADGLGQDALKLILLYRKIETGQQMLPEKFIPCKICHRDYVHKLIDNQGYLLLFFEHEHDYNFFYDFELSNDYKMRKIIDTNGKSFFLTVIDQVGLKQLKCETELGARVSGSKQS